MDIPASPILSSATTEAAAGAATLARRGAAETAGTALLVAAVVGSGIMGERLAGGNAAIALLANAIATGGILFALIAALAPLSGAHLNPVVTLAAAAAGDMRWRDVAPYIVGQCLGGIVGTVMAHAMFALPLLRISQHRRDGSGQWLGETVATIGLLMMIRRCRGRPPHIVAGVVAAYIMAAYWFTSSTSFANPAVTIARSLTDTFAGIRPADAPAFILAQAAGLVIFAASTRLGAAKQPDRSGRLFLPVVPVGHADHGEHEVPGVADVDDRQ